MPAKTITVEKIAYRVFVNRGRGGFRGFWFCPHSHCYGAFCNTFASDTRDDAIELASEAAQRHEEENHGDDTSFDAELLCQIPPRSLDMHG